MGVRYRDIEFDRLQMYFGVPYVVDCEGALGKITVLSPKIGDMVRIGEKRFYSTLNLFITNTTSCRLMLWDMGIDWNVLTDFQLFCMSYRAIDPEVVALLFDNVDFSKFGMFKKKTGDQEETVLINQEDGVEINEEVYQYIHQYLQMVFNMHPDEKITSSQFLKNAYISNDRMIQSDNEKMGLNKNVTIQSMISACVNHPGFKYKLSELSEVGVNEFFDSVNRLQIYENTTALMKGMYSGMISSKDVDPESYNFMKNI